MSYGNDKFERLEEITTAMAQAMICNAMKQAGVHGSELARRMGVTRSRPTQILQRNMTMRTFARSLAACGFEVRFTLVPTKEQPR